MQTVKRRVEDCPICENRGQIWVGADEQDFPCPLCNCWCPFCLEQSVSAGPSAARGGPLFAAVRRTSAGLELFEGYLCDWHKRLFTCYVGITPAMVGRLKPGDAFISVQTLLTPHAAVALYGYAEAKNWRELEPDAFRAVAAQRRSRYGSRGEYPCPPELAERALAPDWAPWRVGERLERRVLANGSFLTTWAIAEA